MGTSPLPSAEGRGCTEVREFPLVFTEGFLEASETPPVTSNHVEVNV